METLLNKINLTQIDHQLFDQTAQAIATALSEPYKITEDKKTKQLTRKPLRDANKSSQIRRFYEDILNWETQLNQSRNEQERNEKYRQLLPMIKMLNAKVAYAYGRDTVDEQFRAFIQHCIRQLEPDQPDSFKHFKLLFEAVIGFMKNTKQR